MAQGPIRNCSWQRRSRLRISVAASKLRFEPLRAIRATLVENHRYFGLCGEELSVSTLHGFTTVFRGFNNEQDFVDKSGHGQGGTGIAQEWKVENHVVKLARL